MKTKTDKEILNKIAEYIADIYLTDMSRFETAVGKLLEEGGYVKQSNTDFKYYIPIKKD